MDECNICQECKKIVEVTERHTYSHCLIARAFPLTWRDIVKHIEHPIDIDRVMEKDIDKVVGEG